MSVSTAVMVIILLEADDRWGWLTVEAGLGDTDGWWRTEVEKILEADNDDDPDIGKQW